MGRVGLSELRVGKSDTRGAVPGLVASLAGCRMLSHGGSVGRGEVQCLACRGLGCRRPWAGPLVAGLAVGAAGRGRLSRTWL